MAITTSDFFNALHSTDNLNRISNFTYCIDTDWEIENTVYHKRTKYKLTDANQRLSKTGLMFPKSKYKGNLWFCPNLFATRGYSFKDTDVKILNAMVIDLDYKKTKLTECEVYDEMMQILGDVNLTPTIVTESGHGLQLFFKMVNHTDKSDYPFVLVNSPKIVSWYSQLAHGICNLLRDCGADMSATNIGRTCRVPDSYNFKDFNELNGKVKYEALKHTLNNDMRVKVAYIDADNTYTLQYIDSIVIDRSEWASKNSQQYVSNPKKNKNYLNELRVADLKRWLVEDKLGDMNGKRHTYLIKVKQLGGNINEFNLLFSDPLKQSEVDSINQLFVGKRKGHITNKTIISSLGISDNDTHKNKVILSDSVKQSRKIERAIIKSYNKFLKQALLDFQILYILKSRTITNKVLSSELNLSIRTIKRRRNMTNEELSDVLTDTYSIFNNINEQFMSLPNRNVKPNNSELIRAKDIVNKLSERTTKKELKSNIIDIKKELNERVNAS